MLTSQSRASAPSSDEIEVSLLGPGFGEAVVAHLGLGNWALIDSCLTPEGEPAGLEYLEALGVDPVDVVLIVASHWHDDHIGGMAKLVQACSNARFAYSGALRAEEFYALVGSRSERSLIRRSGVSEFANVVAALGERGGTGQPVAPMPAVRNRRLWTRGAAPAAAVDALSPSDAAVYLSQQALAAELPEEGETKRAVPAPSPNHSSVVLWVSVGAERVLLGADLEETPQADTGWTAILDDADLHGDPATVFKVPHHGSKTAEQPRIWDEALGPEPLAMITPFERGRVKLPTDDDRARISGYTPNAYLTSTRPRGRRHHAPPVARTLREMGVRPVVATPPLGHVRLRKSVGHSDWTCETFGAAGPI